MQVPATNNETEKSVLISQVRKSLKCEKNSRIRGSVYIVVIFLPLSQITINGFVMVDCQPIAAESPSRLKAKKIKETFLEYPKADVRGLISLRPICTNPGSLSKHAKAIIFINFKSSIITN